MRLKTSTIGILLSCILTLTMLISEAVARDDEIENMLPNPDFEINGTNGWSIDAAHATLTVDDKEESPTGTPVMMATINSVGAESWEPEIHSPSFALENGETYTYSFWAKAEPGSTRSIAPTFEETVTYAGMGQGISLTDEWVEYHYTGVWGEPNAPTTVIHIGFNFQTDDVWFSHFRVYEGEYVEEEFDDQPQIAVSPSSSLATTWGAIKEE